MAGRTDPRRSFGRQDRLRRPEEFAAVMASRSRLSGGCFELRYRERPSDEHGTKADWARLGLIVPKRLAKRAVLRNLLKRLAREAFRQSQASLPPLDFVLRLNKPPLVSGNAVDPGKRREWRCCIDNLLAGVAR